MSPALLVNELIYEWNESSQDNAFCCPFSKKGLGNKKIFQ